MRFDWFPLHFFMMLDPKVLIISACFVILWLLFFREKAGTPMPNTLMKKYARTPLLIILLWVIRGTIIFLSITLITSIIIPKNTTRVHLPPEAYIIALDISKSMETDDISPSRIEYAKSFLVEKVPTLPATGLIVFAGKTFVLSPLTTDGPGIRHLIETTSTDTINQGEKDTSGTNIGDALIQASTLFPESIAKKHIILITDGRANLGLDPIIAADALRERDISVSVIALGSLSGTILTHIVDNKREPLLDGSGNTINGDIDMETLRYIAEVTRGNLVHIINSTKTSLDASGIFPLPTSPLAGADSSARDEDILILLLGILALIHLILSLIFWKKYKYA